MRDQLGTVQESFGETVDFEGVTQDREEALRSLARDEVDVVVEMPDDPLSEVRSGRRAVIQIHHDRLDPFQERYVGVIARVAVDEINRTVVEQVVGGGGGRGGRAREPARHRPYLRGGAGLGTGDR